MIASLSLLLNAGIPIFGESPQLVVPEDKPLNAAQLPDQSFHDCVLPRAAEDGHERIRAMIDSLRYNVEGKGSPPPSQRPGANAVFGKQGRLGPWLPGPLGAE